MTEKNQKGTLTRHQGFLEPTWEWIWDSGSNDKAQCQNHPDKKVADRSQGTASWRLRQETLQGHPWGLDCIPSPNSHPNHPHPEEGLS